VHFYEKNDNKMKQRVKRTKPVQKGTIDIDTKKCKACWKCVDVCPNKVIGKINLLWHKHAKIVNSDYCIECLQCVKVCEFNAVINLKNLV